MKRLAICSIVIFFLWMPSAMAEPRRTVAVIDFENINKEKNLEWLGTGIAETLTTQLSRLREITVVERSRLHAALKEIKFNRSEFVDPETASKVGKVVGADSIVLGSYQKFENQIRLAARLVEVETGRVAAPTSVDGTYQKIFELQDALAANLSKEITGTLAPSTAEVQRPAGIDAFQLFSDGVYYLRNDLVPDALNYFDQALQRDPSYGEAHFYRGLALAKLKRWDEAAAALKRALPRSEPVRLIKWSWDVPYEGHPSRRGLIRVLDEKNFASADHFSKEGTLKMSDQVIFTEHSGKDSVLHMVDLRQRSAQRLVISSQIPLMQVAFGGTSQLVAVQGEEPRFVQPPYQLPLYLINAAEGRMLAQARLEVRSILARPIPVIWRNVFYLWFPFAKTMRTIDLATGRPKWERRDLALIGGVGGFLSTKTHGDVFVVKSATEKRVHLIRAVDGADAWSADLLSDDAFIVAEDLVVVMEPRRRVAAFDLESGRLVAEIPLQPAATAVDIMPGYTIKLVAYARQGTILYFAAENETLCAVDLRGDLKAGDRVLWKIPLEHDVHSLFAEKSHVYIGTNKGDLLILDAASGKTLASAKVARKNLSIEDVDDAIVLARSGASVFALDPATGAKKWEFLCKVPYPEPQRFKNVVILRSDRKQVSVLDAATGSVLWQAVGKQTPSVHTTKDSLFLADEGGIKEYGVESKPTGGLTDKEVFTELAGILVQQGNLDEAGRLLAKVTGEIDPDYAPARCLKATVLKGDRAAAVKELVACVDLSGKESQRAQQVLEELKRDYGLQWRTRVGEAIPVEPQEVQGKIVSLGLIRSKDPRIVALNRVDGKVAWYQPGQRFIAASRSPDPNQLLYVTGDEQNSQRAHLYSVAVGSGESRKVATFDLPGSGGVFARLDSADRYSYLQVWASDLATQKQWTVLYAFEGAGAKKIWERTFESTVNAPGGFGIRVVPLRAWGEYVAFAMGNDLWVLRGADGKDHAHYLEDNAYHGIASVSLEGILYVANGGHTAMVYDLPGKKELLRLKVAGVEEDNILSTQSVRDGILYDTDGRSVFAVDLRRDPPSSGSRVIWRVEAGPNRRYDAIFLGERLLVERDDDVAEELDPVTGRMRQEHTLFWDPDEVLVRGETAFVMNSEGVAYAFRLRP